MTRYPARLLALMLCLLLTAGPSLRAAPKNNNNDRKYLEQLKRQVKEVEQEIKQLDGVIDKRKKELAAAPKTIDPAKKQVEDTDRQFEQSREQMVGLRQTLVEADEKLAGLMKELKSDFDGSAELLAAEQKLVEAQRKLAAVEAPLRRELEKDETYQRLAARVREAKVRVAVTSEQQQAGDASPSQVRLAAAELLRYELQLNRIEEEAFTASDDYNKALAAVEAAQEHLRQVRIAAGQKLKSDPQYAKAEAAAEAARSEWKAGQDTLRQAGADRAAARANLAKLEAQVKVFAYQTDQLIARRQQLQVQLKTRQQRVKDYQRRK